MSSSDSDEENAIRYGTPLEPYEEDEVPSKRKYQEPTDQYAVDAHGRRRFHGAFTGGFSAGFGNTVGTPEGWAPATFKSSRSEKAQVSRQRPEDFMDDEDRGENGIAPRHMETQSEFSGKKRPYQKQYYDGPIPGEPVLEQLVRAVHETAAVRMLRAMGWRPGQGAGQRLTGRQKKASRRQHKVYGCYMPEEVRPTTDASSDSSDSEFEYDTLFAPDDYEPYILRRKSDRFGIGYSGLSRHSVLGTMAGEYGQGSTSHLVMKEKGKKVSIRGQAFGVGALEADDEDIYSTEDMSHYDFTLGGTAEQKEKKKGKQESNVLEGFVRASKPLPPLAAHPPPALPRGYTPLPAGARRSRFEPSSAPQRDQGLGRHDLSAEARGALLGETPLPKASIPIQSDPIAQLLGRNVSFVTTDDTTTDKTTTDNTTIDNTSTDKAEDFISIKDSGKEIKKVFKPFVSDPAKQARYEKYLKDNSVLDREGEMDRLTAWERNREISEFEQAAKLYKPLSGVMGDRFTHASEPDDAINPLTAVAKSSLNRGQATPAQIEAARVGAYGVMTRAETRWRPEALVCKRFNVPELGARPETRKEDRPKVSYSIFNYMETSIHDKESFAKEQSTFSGSKSLNRELINEKTDKKTPEKTKYCPVDTITADPKPSTSTDTGFNKRMTVAELFLKESEKDLKNNEKVEVTDTINKFDKMDLYKSIFLSDSENEDDKDAAKNDKSSSVFDNVNEFVDVPRNVERNLSPPRGIFANIDFDEINSWKRNAEKKAEENTEVINKTDSADNTNDFKDNKIEENDIYGPKVPDNLKKKLEEPQIITIEKPMFRSKSEREAIEVSSSSSDSWVEAKDAKSKKKKKKNKKHKKQKKSKSKKKDR